MKRAHLSLVARFALLLLAACQSSGRYAAPGYAGAAVGVAAAGAAANRAFGGCLAECIAGTHCNPRSGLCESEGSPRLPPVSDPSSAPSAPPAAPGSPLAAPGAPASASPAKKGHARASSPVLRSEPYPPGHEYVVPASGADAGCETPAHDAPGAPISCEMDAGST